MADIYNLQRFVDAQADVYGAVCEELRNGEKRSHWMWFIFPQFKGLGVSATATHFAIASREEAQAYLRHEILGPRLRECTQLVLQVEQRSVEKIFGYPDHLKFRSSMTLFATTAQDNQIFNDALAKYFNGQPDATTLDLLSREKRN